MDIWIAKPDTIIASRLAADWPKEVCSSYASVSLLNIAKASCGSSVRTLKPRSSTAPAQLLVAQKSCGYLNAKRRQPAPPPENPVTARPRRFAIVLKRQSTTGITSLIIIDSAITIPFIDDLGNASMYLLLAIGLTKTIIIGLFREKVVRMLSVPKLFISLFSSWHAP